MLVAIDLNVTLGLCYSNKEIERHMRENLTKEQKEKVRDPKRNYLTLFGKPLAVLNITGWGRTPQRNVIVYCNLTLAAEMEKDKKSTGANNERNTRRKVKNGFCRFDHAGGISTRTNKRRNGALQAHAQFGRVAPWFDAHRYCNRLHRALRTTETGC